MNKVLIEQIEDSRIEDYRAVREADLLGRRGIFIAEGEVVLRVLIQRGRFKVRSVLLANTKVATLAPLLASLSEATPIYIASQQVMNAIVGFPIHRGILAAGEIGDTLRAEELLENLEPGPRRVVVLEGIVNHDNIGGIFRNCAAFGVDAVFFDHVSCDPLYRKAIRVSVGASMFVPFARFEQMSSMMALLRQHSFSTLALTPSQEAVSLEDIDPLSERVALLLGAEGPGLNHETLAQADHQVRIAMTPGFDSLNVATTSGIVLHHVFERHGKGA